MDKAVPLNTEDKLGISGLEFRGQELLEVSAVTIPSNPDALQRFVKSPTLHPVIAEIAEEQLAKNDDVLTETEDDPMRALLERIQNLEERVSTPVEVDESPAEVEREEEPLEVEDGANDGENLLDVDLYAVAIAAAEEAFAEMEGE